MKKKLTQVFYSFPFQLVILHTRSNILLLGIWMLLVAFMSGWLGERFGVRYLFLSPEYLGRVGFWSFYLLGLAYGGMTVTWNMTTYLLDAHHFPFLASLKRPFTKFVLNNGFIPLSFALLLLGMNFHFQWYYEYENIGQALYRILGFLMGFASLVVIFSIYFRWTNKDIFSFSQNKETLPPNLATAPGNREVTIEDIRSSEKRWRVDTYLTESFRPRIVRSVAHYDTHLLNRVFKQNHINALIVQLFSMLILVGLSFFVDNPWFRIPAGASVFLLASLLIALVGAITYWFGRWRVTVIVFLLVLANLITRIDTFRSKNHAFGLDYVNTPTINYSYEHLKEICSPANSLADKAATTEILNNWLKKNQRTPLDKPKMVFYCISGGGLKSALWSMQVMRHLDSLTNGQFMEQTALISGASGGMIGAAYYRELLLQQKRGLPVRAQDSIFLQKISKDLLNSIAFTIVTNDIFIPWSSVKIGDKKYQKDRGYIFETQLNDNLDDPFLQRLIDYREPERSAQIPLLFLTPSVVNDGRRMIISPQPVSYMMAAPVAARRPDAVDIDAVDYGRLLDRAKGYELLFSTALRMNATFPYVLPNVHLPTVPEIEVMDAGFRDNFGLKSSTRFIQVFQDWIKENTSGVVVIQVRSYDRDKEIDETANRGVVESIFNPIGIAGQILSLQDYEHDTNIGFLYDLLGDEHFDLVRFTYLPREATEEAPISFHLTQREKENILESIQAPNNQASLQRVVDLLNLNKPTATSIPK